MQEAIAALKKPSAGTQIFEGLRSSGYQLPGAVDFSTESGCPDVEQALAAAQRGITLNDSLSGAIHLGLCLSVTKAV